MMKSQLKIRTMRCCCKCAISDCMVHTAVYCSYASSKRIYSDVHTLNHYILQVNYMRLTPPPSDLPTGSLPSVQSGLLCCLQTDPAGTHFIEFPLTYRSTIFHLKTHYTISYMRLFLSLHDSALLHETSVYNIRSIMAHLQLGIKNN